MSMAPGSMNACIDRWSYPTRAYGHPFLEINHKAFLKCSKELQSCIPPIILLLALPVLIHGALILLYMVQGCHGSCARRLQFGVQGSAILLWISAWGPDHDAAGFGAEDCEGVDRC